MRKAANRPTDTELAILRTLWDLGPATVRQVFEALASEREDLSYAAVLRMMQVMADKGLLKRDDEERSHIYRPAQAREQVQGTLVDDLLERAFKGNALEMLAATLSRKRMSVQEREKAAQLIEEARKRKP